MRLQVRNSCENIRLALGLKSHILKTPLIGKIETETMKINGKWSSESYYPNYEVGRKFMIDHIMESLREKIGLDDEEAENLHEAFEGTHYHNDVGEHSNGISALENLEALDDRGRLILKSLKLEISNLGVILGKESKWNVFSSPYASINFVFLVVKGKDASFQDIADHYRWVANRMSKTTTAATMRKDEDHKNKGTRG